MKSERRRISVLTIILLIIIAILAFFAIKPYLPKKDTNVFKQVGSKKQLEKIYNRKNQNTEEKLKQILTLPASFMMYGIEYATDDATTEIVTDSSMGAINNSSGLQAKEESTKEYSTTNIQVENVDEADITKTDGEYIYSLSGDSIVITSVKNVSDAKVVAKFEMKENAYVQDLLLYENKLVAIGTKSNGNTSTYSSYRQKSTYLEVFDITDRTNPKSIKTLQINSPYFTCRMIAGKVYVLCTGYIRNNAVKDVELDISYVEDGVSVEIPYTNMYYMENMLTRNQTIVSSLDLNNISTNAEIKTYFIDLDNAYVSENNIYVANSEYEYGSYRPTMSSIFGFKGIIGAFDEDKWEDEDSYRKTTIYKFEINGLDITYRGKAEEKGQMVNQFSMDEYNGNLRAAMYDGDGTRVIVFDKDMSKIGETDYMAEGETMYSSRFIGDKAYLVTYKNMDPLFVVDLSDSKSPKVLGELKIPGYSTYLHPYDENHIIGIGMETKGVIRKDLNGKVISTSSQIVGMKMALFDVSDVNNPKQISTAIIGDSRTTSAVLTNHKALLFSKEKNLLAIPVNNYSADFEVSGSYTKIDDLINAYSNKTSNFIAEGYEVYNIDLENGFVKKGTITHSFDSKNNVYTYKSITHLLRGMYIEDNLYTVSEQMIKINKLDTLELLKEIRITDVLEK